MMEATTEVKITNVETRYAGQVVRVYRVGGAWLEGDWEEYFLQGAHQPGQWLVMRKTTCYGGRAATQWDIAKFDDRPAAHAHAVQILAETGVEVPEAFLLHAEWTTNFEGV